MKCNKKIYKQILKLWCLFDETSQANAMKDFKLFQILIYLFMYKKNIFSFSYMKWEFTKIKQHEFV